MSQSGNISELQKNLYTNCRIVKQKPTIRGDLLFTFRSTSSAYI